MLSVNGRDLDWIEHTALQDLRGVSGVIHKRLIQVETGGPGDFDFRISRVERHATNRHNHNWSQIQYLREGTYNYAPGESEEARSVGYVAEGTFYGPQQNDAPFTMVTVQFGGASGQGYMSHQMIRRATQELSKTGKFLKGVYETTSADGNVVRKEASRAVAEFLKGGPVTYPPAHYKKPIWGILKDFPWLPMPGQPDIEMQYIGTFSGGIVEIRMVRGKAGSTFHQGGNQRRQLFFLDDGELGYEGQLFAPESTFYSTEEETIAFKATRPWEALLITLPSFGMAASGNRPS